MAEVENDHSATSNEMMAPSNNHQSCDIEQRLPHGSTQHHQQRDRPPRVTQPCRDREAQGMDHVRPPSAESTAETVQQVTWSTKDKKCDARTCRSRLERDTAKHNTPTSSDSSFRESCKAT